MGGAGRLGACAGEGAEGLHGLEGWHACATEEPARLEGLESPEGLHG